MRLNPSYQKNLLSITIIGIYAVFFTSIGFHFRSSDFEKRFRKSERKNIGIEKRDRMDLAMLHEMEITKDPALGYVPRERLAKALNYTKSLLNNNQLQATAAIPGIVWQERGPNNVGGRTRAILIDPNDATKKTIFAGGVGGGLWKTTDITQTPPIWNAIDDMLNNISITCISFNPLNTSEMYFGTGEGFYNADAQRGNGIFKSTDGGNTWSQLGSTANNANFQYVQRVLVHPTSGDVYAATRNGLFRSSNGGTTWTNVLSAGNGSTSSRIADIEIAADNSIYASAGLFQTDGIYKSSNGNAGSWTKLNTGANGFATTGFQRLEIACAPSDANVLYVISQGGGNGSGPIWKSSDAGLNWTTVNKPTDADPGIGNDFTRGQAWYDLTAAVDPNNSNTLIIGGVDLFKTSDGGSTWTQLSHWYGGFGYIEVHADQHAIVFEPGSSFTVYFGNDGGIYRSMVGGSNAQFKSQNYNITQFYACAIHPTASSHNHLAGAQDNGSNRLSQPGIGPSIEVTGGDGCFVHIDQDQPQYQFTSYVYNNYYRSTNGGNTFTGMGGNNNGSFVNPTDYDNLNNNLYCNATAGNYYVILNAPVSNTLNIRAIAEFGGASIRAVTVSPNTSNRVFFGLSNGRVVRVDAANSATPTATWINNGAGMPGSSVSCIEIEEGNDNRLIVTYSNYGVNSVWQTSNGGTNWVSIEGNLPDMPIRWAMISPLNNNQALLATELGVWSTDLINGNTTNWAPSSSGLANTRITMLQRRSSDNLVIASTHGRGVFSSDIFSPASADFYATPTIGYLNKPIQFIDQSVKATSYVWDFGDGTSSAASNPVKTYNTPGLYTISLTINGNINATRSNYIHILPNKGTPYTPAMGGNFDAMALDYGSYTVNGTAWVRGNSATAGKNGTNSGSFVWVTGLSGNYTDMTEAYLYTPNFNLLAPGSYTLRFYRKNLFELNYDGFILQYSLDKGDTWTPLGNFNPPNWYDFANNAMNTSFPLNQAYFNGTKSTFTLQSTDVSFLSGNANVSFRFVFRSDQSVVNAGVAIDDFEIIGPPNTPLPVSLISLTARTYGSHNLLKWKTASETNNDGFMIERSENAKDFQPIGFVKGAGNSNSVRTYEFVDTDVNRLLYFYRLKQVDINGRFEYSETVSLNRNQLANEELLIYPNPATESLYVAASSTWSGEVDISLYDYQGKKVWHQSESNGGAVVKIDLAKKFSAGLYFVKAEYNGKSVIKKVLIR
ncbi:MAG TPA: PKD domain-containing protein [Bacteroidia bacterium]|nr:PKD domain-containing protein [Bacteroidia bacterium]